MSIENLKSNLENAVKDIIKKFEEKQDLYFEFFVSDDCTDVACFGGVNYISLSDLCYDVFTEQPKGLIVEWQEETLEKMESQGLINYQSYCRGLRYK